MLANHIMGQSLERYWPHGRDRCWDLIEKIDAFEALKKRSTIGTVLSRQKARGHEVRDRCWDPEVRDRCGDPEIHDASPKHCIFEQVFGLVVRIDFGQTEHGARCRVAL